MSKFSSPASAGDLQKLSSSFPRSSSNNSLSSFKIKENIEVEKKVELSDLAALHAFENKVKEAGGRLKKEKCFTDCYYDSADLLLTRTDHYLRDRDGVWELKVPCPESSTHTSVYQELEGPEDIAQYFAEEYPHGSVELPFVEKLGNKDRTEGEEELSPISPTAVADATSVQDLVSVLSPFVAFTTKRRQWELFMRDETFSIDVVRS
jgi:adenylate cyclase class IV